MLKIFTKKFAKTQICDILYTGLGNPTPEDVTVFCGCKDNIFTGSDFIGACWAHFVRHNFWCVSNPASSFFVPILENRGKSNNKKTLPEGGTTCATHTQKSQFIPILSVDREVSL